MSNLNLFNANSQWANRPADERFESLEALLQFTRDRQKRSTEKLIEDPRVLSVVPQGDELALIGPNGGAVPLSHRAFVQLAARAQANPGFLKTLTPATTAIVLNEKIQQRGRLLISEDIEGVTDESPKNRARGLNILFEKNGVARVRAITTDIYSRIWDADVVERLVDLAAGGDWVTPPARESHGSINSGLYAGDRDIFAVLVNEKNRIHDGSQGGLARGFFVANSEVGAAAFTLTTFLYRFVCGNHIVWGAENVSKLRVVHIGRANARAFDTFRFEIKKYANQAASVDENRIEAAKSFLLGGDKNQVLDLVFGKRRILSRVNAAAAYDLAEQNDTVDGSPRSAWGFAQGVTRLSQSLVNANDRTELDVAAGRVLDLVSVALKN